MPTTPDEDSRAMIEQLRSNPVQFAQYRHELFRNLYRRSFVEFAKAAMKAAEPTQELVDEHVASCKGVDDLCKIPELQLLLAAWVMVSLARDSNLERHARGLMEGSWYQTFFPEARLPR